MSKSETCKLCKAPVSWVQTIAGNILPLDAEPTNKGRYIVVNGIAESVTPDLLFEPFYDGPRFTNHLETCSKNPHRRKEK